jgi:hypothetical protein
MAVLELVIPITYIKYRSWNTCPGYCNTKIGMTTHLLYTKIHLSPLNSHISPLPNMSAYTFSGPSPYLWTPIQPLTCTT